MMPDTFKTSSQSPVESRRACSTSCRPMPMAHAIDRTSRSSASTSTSVPLVPASPPPAQADGLHLVRTGWLAKETSAAIGLHDYAQLCNHPLPEPSAATGLQQRLQLA